MSKAQATIEIKYEFDPSWQTTPFWAKANINGHSVVASSANSYAEARSVLLVKIEQIAKQAEIPVPPVETITIG